MINGGHEVASDEVLIVREHCVPVLTGERQHVGVVLADDQRLVENFLPCLREYKRFVQ